MATFKVGDVLIRVNEEVAGDNYQFCSTAAPGTEVEVLGIENGAVHFIALDGDDEGDTCEHHKDNFEYPNPPQGETTMSNITNPVDALIAKAQGIDDTTKTLREASLESADGRMTSGGSAALLGRLWQRERADIAKDLQELEAEADKPAATPKA